MTTDGRRIASCQPNSPTVEETHSPASAAALTRAPAAAASRDRVMTIAIATTVEATASAAKSGPIHGTAWKIETSWARWTAAATTRAAAPVSAAVVASGPSGMRAVRRRALTVAARMVSSP